MPCVHSVANVGNADHDLSCNDIVIAAEDGVVWVSVKRVCEALGVDERSQMRKLGERSWATAVQKAAVAHDGALRQVTMVDLDTLGMWLATIDERRVSDDATTCAITGCNLCRWGDVCVGAGG